MTRQVPVRYRHLRKFAFGDNPALADELLELVMKGIKTATCSTEDEPNTSLPGEQWIVLDGRGEPRCVIETTEVTYRKFNATPPSRMRKAKATGAWPIGAMRIGPISDGSDDSART